MELFELPGGLPTDFTRAMLRNGKAMQRWAMLGEDGRKKLLDRVSSAHSRAEYDAIVDSLVGWQDGHGPMQQ